MENLENSAIIQEMTKALKEETEKRKKHILKRNVPNERTLKNALMTLNRQEIDDIRYNVGLSGTSSLKKAELIEKLVPSIIEFAQTWFVSMIDDQFNAFRHLAEKDGISTEFREDEMRLDYFQSIGLLASGATVDGQMAWYMPDEIAEEFKKLNNDTFKKVVENNSEVLQVATGILFYYGVMEYDKLFTKTKTYIDVADDLGLNDFKKLLFNGSCWQRHIMSTEQFVYYYSVIEPIKIFSLQQQTEIGYANLSYTKVYEAGIENFIDATSEYRELAQFFMKNYQQDVMTAANLVAQIYSIFQNDGKMKEIVSFLDSKSLLAKEKYNETLIQLIVNFHQNMRQWILKGHKPIEFIKGEFDNEIDEEELMTLSKKEKAKVGRNDLCPCGSGKKYKKCCMAKDLGQK